MLTARAECAACKRSMHPNCVNFLYDPHDTMVLFCDECLKLPSCDGCEALIAATDDKKSQCNSCGFWTCGKCTRACESCGPFCPDPDCIEAYENHMHECGDCGNLVCWLTLVDCTMCGKYFCRDECIVDHKDGNYCRECFSNRHCDPLTAQ
jgi:hypothetical protein